MKQLFAIIVLFLTIFTFAQAVEIEVRPTNPIQGEPILITATYIKNPTDIKSAYFDKQQLNFFIYQDKVSALGGIDLAGKVGTSTIMINLKDGTKISKEIKIESRPKIEAPIDIPKKLGGNTKEAVKKILTNLIDEQSAVNKITKIIKPKSYWKENFIFPVKNPLITDNYGYARDTVGVSIAHKGSDFKASVGTEIYAINRGIVRDKKTYPTFGRTVIIDHGLGLYSMYLHLSKVKVNVGELISVGQIIGLSGDSGYATGPHLHLTIRINGISIDPMKFYELFNVKI